MPDPKPTTQTLTCWGGPWDGLPHRMDDGVDYYVLPPTSLKGGRIRTGMYVRQGKRLRWVERTCEP